MLFEKRRRVQRRGVMSRRDGRIPSRSAMNWPGLALAITSTRSRRNLHKKRKNVQKSNNGAMLPSYMQLHHTQMLILYCPYPLFLHFPLPFPFPLP